jgi:DNA polymerase delta subunit 1
MAPLVWVFFDDEMAGQNPNRMPRPNNLGDLISQSGVVIFRQNEKEPFEACIFSLGGSEPLLRKVNRREIITPQERDLYSRARIYTFGSECDLMLAWRRMIEIVCPDFLCGYNSVDFDLPYMVRRSTTGVAVGQDTHVAFRRLSKVIEHEHQSRTDDGGTYWKGLTEIRKERFQSKAFGLRENDKAGTTGMTQFDVLRVLKQDSTDKKRSYKLDKVTREELTDYYKLPLPHTEITPKATSPYDVMRTLLDRYCFMDSILPKKIVDKKTYDIIYTEMARITGVTMDHLLGKGQRVKITQRLLKTARRARLDDKGISRKICPSPETSPYSTEGPISFLIPYQRACPLDVNPSYHDTEDILEGEDDDDDHMTRKAEYSGATVLKAKRGYYKEPTPTLDFSSLYPSIMRSCNYCVTTYLGTREQAEARGLKCAWDLRKEKNGGNHRWTPFDAMPDGDFIVAPNNAAFITLKHRVGLMCVDLGEILAARSQRKKMMAKYDKGSTERAAHNGAQLGLKVTANSMYGYTAGCNTAVSEAVTSTGRFLLKFTRDLVYERGQREARYANEQLYGDTDSIMFRMFNVAKIPGETDRYDLHEAARMGVELAKWVTSIFQAFGLFAIVLEFEKVYETWVLKSKKCYAVYKHLFDVKTGKLTAYLSSSGLESVRRDVTLFTQRVFERAIKMTVQERDLDGAIRFTQKMFTELKEGRVPIEELIITGGFAKRADQYKNPVPHIEAVRKQMDDDPNNAPTVGSRIDWVIACLSDDVTVNRKAKVYEKAVMPEYLRAHNMRLDYDGYITKCAKPFCRFFAPALAPKMNATQGQAYVMRTVFDDYFRERDTLEKRKKSSLISSFARGFLRNEKKRKTSTSTPNDMGDDSGEEVQRALLRADPSRASFHKKRRTNPAQIRKELSTFSVDALTTTEETFEDWMSASGTTKKGTRYR